MPSTPTATQKEVAISSQNSTATDDNVGSPSSSGWWIKWVFAGILIVGIVGLGFYTYRLKGQLDLSKKQLEESKKETSNVCMELEKFKSEIANYQSQMDELKKKIQEHECTIEKNKKKNKELKMKLMSTLQQASDRSGCDPVTGTCPLPPSHTFSTLKGNRGTEIIRD